MTRILDFEGSQQVLAKYSGNPIQALVHAYPEIGLEQSKFKSPSINWQHIGYMKQFFIEHARTNGFDPLIAENWYSVPTSIYARKGASRVLHYYQRSISTALSELFPNIGIDKSKFVNLPKKYWQDEGNRKKLLLKFARENSLDAYNPEHWYGVSRQKFLATKGANSVIEYHDRNLPRMVMDLLPEIGATESGFKAYLEIKPKNSETHELPVLVSAPKTYVINLGPKFVYKKELL
eukprot:Phypoly_transcript_16871.p1 GENE.Phypoly_transcript_16871~~Phypoly_transcript_16871.p1  ORF type:complete len:257 (+),score=38.97 Phypoly_transcript_16871:68-772(+)